MVMRREWVGVVVVCISLMSSVCPATSVYTIGHDSGLFVKRCPLNAFDIVNDQIVLRGKVDLWKYGAGGIDVTMDELTNTLFVSFEMDPSTSTGGNYIEIVDAATLQSETITVDEDGVEDLTSLVFDNVTRKLYGTDRDDNVLHVLEWNPARKIVSLEKTIELENIDYACGLAINGDLLYVSEFHYSYMEYYPYVNCYDISEDFAFVETIDMGDKTVAIDYEPAGNVLYGGAFSFSDYRHLIRRPLSEPNDLVQKDLGAGIIGVACDEETAGRVLLTTYRNGGSLEMWDTADWETEPNTLTVLDATAIYDVNNMDGANMAYLSGLVVVETPKRPMIQVVKRDDVETCISPESADPNVVYTIGISDPNDDGHTNVWIVDHLPREVDFVSAEPADPNYGYDLETHTYTWYLPYLQGYDPGNPPPGDPNEYFSLTVRVNEWAEPMSRFTNIATVESSSAYSWTAVETEVCCWGGDVIYVDPQAEEVSGYIDLPGFQMRWATGRNTGTSWEDAYRSLPAALARAAKGCGSEIWVAGGIYRPADTVLMKTFKIPADVSVYGGFAGSETSLDQRSILKYPTVLSGYIDETTNEDVVVTMNGNGAVLDGFVIEKASLRGIDGSGFSSTIANCTITNNEERGIHCENGNLIVRWCQISENGEQGIYHQGSNYSLIVENCKVYDNQYDGIRTASSTSTILNSLFYQNGLGSTAYDTYYGINLVNPPGSPNNPVIRNNTIVQNVNEGIRRLGGSLPDIVNCIVYYNNDNGEGPQLAGLDPDETAYYCCIADCNEVNNNFNDVPGFAYTTEPNDWPVVGNYHLAYDSPCVDSGDSDEYTDELDIDGEPRIYDWVDRGADEAYSCDFDLSPDDIYNPLDFSADGIINYEEFSVFASAWLSYDPGYYTDPNLTGNWNQAFNLDDAGDSQYVTDLADLAAFCRDEWLWIACWRQNQFDMDGMMAIGGGGEGMFMEIEPLFAEPVEENPYIDMPIAQIASLVMGIDAVLDAVDNLLAENPSNTENLLEIKDFLEDVLNDIKASRQ